MDDGNNSNNNKPSNEKATQAYKLFSQEKEACRGSYPIRSL